MSCIAQHTSFLYAASSVLFCIVVLSALLLSSIFALLCAMYTSVSYTKSFIKIDRTYM